jgi:hypothetical protein
MSVRIFELGMDCLDVLVLVVSVVAGLLYEH